MESQFFLHCTCPICYQPYDTQERIPRFITCSQGHTICSKCISIQIGMQDPFQCPFDKQLIIMLENVISRFPINRALASIIEEGHSNCEVHIDKKLDLVCRPCRQQICDRCERKGPHTGHEVSVIEEALDEAKQKMDSIKQLVQKVHQSMEASQAEINLREKSLLNEVDVKFSECIALLLKKREETQLLVREQCQRIKDLVEMEALAKEDVNLVKIMNWSNVIEKQTSFMNGLAVQPIFYDLLEEDIESLNQNVDASIAQEQERIQNIVKDIEKITVNFNPHLEHTFESLCEVINISREERSEEKDSFTWKADWNKLDLLTGFRTAEEIQFINFVDKIIETYKFRLEAVQHLSQGSPTSPKMPPFYLCSFSCFLGSDPKCNKLLKWYILDSTLQNSEKKVKLDELKLSENLFQILVEKINKLPEQIRIDGLLLKKEEKDLLKEKIKEYGHKSLLITHLNFLLDSYMKDRWIDACYAADQIIKIGEKDSYIEKVMKDATRVNCLRLALVIEKAIEAQETEEAVQLINYLQGLVKSILDGNELHASQAQVIISEAVERVPEEASQFKQLKERLSLFNNAGYSQRELSKTLQDYIPTTKKVQVHIEGECQEAEEEEVHYWEEKGENSAYKMKQLTNEMLRALEPYVDFHNHLNTVQQIVTYEERKNLGYLYKESVDMSDI